MKVIRIDDMMHVENGIGRYVMARNTSENPKLAIAYIPVDYNGKNRLVYQYGREEKPVHVLPTVVLTGTKDEISKLTIMDDAAIVDRVKLRTIANELREIGVYTLGRHDTGPQLYKLAKKLETL